MWPKIIIVIFLVLILYNLGAGLYYMIVDKGQTKRTVNALTWRVGLSIALVVLLVLGGDVIRGFVFAITFGIVIGTYSSLYVAKNIVAWLGVKRDWSKPDAGAGTRFAEAES